MLIINGYNRKQPLVVFGLTVQGRSHQHYLNLVSADVFKEIFFLFLVWLVNV